MEGEQKLGDFCLICFSNVDRSKLPKQSSLLSNNLNVIFLLRNLLQVPSDLLIGNFKKCGSPFYWISLCENCSQVTSQAMEHHLQILKLVNQLRSVLKLITDKMRDSSGPSETMLSYQDVDKDDKKKSMQEKRLQILKRTREFVTNYHYNFHMVNPFIEGDKLARELDDEDQEDSSLSDDDNPSADYLVVDGKWKCRYCYKLFKRKDNLRYHEEGKHPKIPGRFKCGICGKRINSLHYLSEHIRKMHKSEGTVKTAAIQLDLDDLKEDNEKDDLEREETEQEIGRHVEVNGKWKCRYGHCKQSVCAHEMEKHPEVPGQFECEICGRRFNSKSYLSGHRNSAHKLKTVRSPTKTVRTKRPPRMQIKGQWTCQLCNKEFKNRKSYQHHQREQHPSIPGQFKCDICEKSVNSRFGLLQHRRYIHKLNAEGNRITLKPRDYSKVKERRRSEPKQTCHLCGKIFTNLVGLKRHLKHLHDRQFDIHCHLCGLGVYTSNQLKHHLLAKHKDDPVTLKLIEEGINLWKCGVVGCRARYLRESGLEEHTIKVHGDGDKRLTCAFCGKLFRHGYALKSHEAFHQLGKERPHSCELCGAKFKFRSSIKRHNIRYHPEITTGS